MAKLDTSTAPQVVELMVFRRRSIAEWITETIFTKSFKSIHQQTQILSKQHIGGWYSDTIQIATTHLRLLR